MGALLLSGAPSTGMASSMGPPGDRLAGGTTVLREIIFKQTSPRLGKTG